MDIYTIKKEIVRQCMDTNGFLVLLHSRSEFDTEKYQNLISGINKYADLIGNSEMIDRAIASCLFELLAAITTALDEYSEINHPDLGVVQRAHFEITDLLHNRIFVFPSRG